MKDIHHDVSPPLREMQLLQPDPGTKRWEDGEIPNNPFMLDRDQSYGYPGTGTGKDPVMQDEMGTRRPISTIVNFDGMKGDGTIGPPDPNGAVGTNYYIETVNTAFAVYSKTGSLVYGPAGLNTLWQGFPGGYTSDGDPIVLFDHLANRWLITQFSLPNYPNGPFYELLAVSQTEDPLGAWNLYAFMFLKMPDYPKFGIWPDGYYLSANSFTSGALNWAGPLAAVIERDSMLVGGTARMIFFQQESSMRSMIPADMDGPAPPPGTPGYFLMAPDNNFGDSTHPLRLFQLHVDWEDTANTSFTGPHSISTATFDMSIDYIRQKGTSQKLEALSKYLMHRLQYRNFGTHQSMLANQTVDADGNNHSGIRWYEIRKSNSNWSIYQEGTYAPNEYHRWLGSIAMDGSGNVAMGYSVSGDSIYPSIGITGQLAGDPPGHMTCLEEIVIAGSGSQTGVNRWGDYSSLSVDPVDDATFWYTNEYYPVSGYFKWNTRIASFTINDLEVGEKELVSSGNQEHQFKGSHPNPFSYSTTLQWTLLESVDVKIQVYDPAGQLVTKLVDSKQEAGEHKIIFDASGLSSGIYLCLFNTGKTTEIQKLVLIK